MALNLNRAQLECLYRLKVDPSLAPLVELMKMFYEEAKENLVCQPNVDNIHVLRGRAGQLKEILNLIEASGGLLEKKVGQTSRI